ncbi:MAG: Gfo/Idh/MocA family oxidoreductase [Chitinophagaceae bacterium]
MNTTIDFAVVGFGHIGRRHATIINQHPDCRLVAIIDVNPNVQQHELYPAGVPYFSSMEAYIAAGIKTDVVNVASPNGFHCRHALAALRNHNHVVLEKPMGINRAECEEIIFTALQFSQQVFVVKQNRYSPPVKWMKEVVSHGKIGDVVNVQINCYWNRDDRYYEPGGWRGTLKLDGGTLHTQFSHFVDIMYWVFGDIANIQGRFSNFTHKHSIEFEDTGLIQFDFIRGGFGSLNYSTAVWDKNQESSITVIGTNGSFKIGGQYMNEVEYCHIKDYVMPELPPTNPPNDYGPFKGSAANHHYVIENVVKTLNGTEQISTNALEGMKVVDIIERIYQLKKS